MRIVKGVKNKIIVLMAFCPRCDHSRQAVKSDRWVCCLKCNNHFEYENSYLTRERWNRIIMRGELKK